MCLRSETEEGVNIGRVLKSSIPSKAWTHVFGDAVRIFDFYDYFRCLSGGGYVVEARRRVDEAKRAAAVHEEPPVDALCVLGVAAGEDAQHVVVLELEPADRALVTHNRVRRRNVLERHRPEA